MQIDEYLFSCARGSIIAVFILVTLATLVMIYYFHTGKIEKTCSANPNDKEKVEILFYAFKLYMVILPFILLGFLYMIFILNRFKYELILLFLTLIQSPIIYYILKKSG
jgi:hypothetical protein